MARPSPVTRVWTPNEDPRRGPKNTSLNVAAAPPIPVITRDPVSVNAVPQNTLAPAACIEVSKIKVTIAIEGHKLPTNILPEVGAPGSAKASVTFKVKSGDNELTATVKAKSYRDVLQKVKSSPHGAWAVLQGQLGAGGVLDGAGFTVQPITPKPASEPGSESSSGA